MAEKKNYDKLIKALQIAAGVFMLAMVAAIVYLMAGVTAFGAKYETDEAYQDRIRARKEENAVAESVNANYRGIWKLIEKKALAASINYTVYFFSTGIILVFLTVYAREVLMMASDRIGYFFTVSSIAVLVVRLFGGKLSDQHGALVVLIPGHISHIIALLILAFWAKSSYGLFLLAGVFYGIGLAVVMPVLNAVAVVDSPAGRNGAANATFYFLMDVGMLVASALIGIFIDHAPTATQGYYRAFIVSVGACMLSVAMSALCFNEKSRKRRRES